MKIEQVTYGLHGGPHVVNLEHPSNHSSKKADDRREEEKWKMEEQTQA